MKTLLFFSSILFFQISVFSQKLELIAFADKHENTLTSTSYENVKNHRSNYDKGVYIVKQQDSKEEVPIASVWGFKDEKNDIYKIDKWYGKLKLEVGNKENLSIYSQKKWEYYILLLLPTSKDYFFTTNAHMKPKSISKENIIAYVFNGDESKYEEYKKNNSVSDNLEILKRIITTIDETGKN